MRTLKWLVSIVILLVLVVGVGAPYLIGIWIQKVFPKVFLGPSNATSIQMTLIDYKRGIYSSTAKVAIAFKNATSSNRIVFDEVIQHGPLVFENGPKLALALMNAKSDDPKFTASTRTIWELNKRVLSTISIPTLDVASTPIHVSLQNLNLQINYHSGDETLKADATVDKVELQGSVPSPFSVSFTKLSSSQNLKKENNIWYGSRTANLAELDINTPQGSLAVLHDLSANGQISQNSDKTNIDFKYQAKLGTIWNNPVNSIDFAFSINDMDTKALSNLIVKLDPKKDGATPVNTRELSESALSLISKGIVVKLDRLSIVGKDGEAKADGKVSLPALSGGNIFQLIGALKIDFNLQVPKETLLSILAAHYQNDKSLPANTTPAAFAQQQVDQWTQDKVLIPGANNFLMMKIQFENAKLLVNGVEQHPTPPGAPSKPQEPQVQN